MADPTLPRSRSSPPGGPAARGDVCVELHWTGEGLRFAGGAVGGPSVTLDGDGRDGPSPMQTLLLGLAGCMAADVVHLLDRMRVPPDELRIRLAGDRAPDPPRRYTAIRLVCEVEGVPDEDRHKVQRALDLSAETYCSVLHTLDSGVTLDIRLEGG